MTLLDAKEYDPEKERKKKTRLISVVVVVLLAACLAWWFRFWPEERVANQFFNALQKQDYETAYGIWMHDPQWKQHPEKYSKYGYGDFLQDWPCVNLLTSLAIPSIDNSVQFKCVD